MNEKTMSIYAETLVFNRDLKKGRINGETVGVANALIWKNAVIKCLIPAYTIAKYNYDHMGTVDTVEPIDQAPLYDSLRTVVDLIGEVNGAKLNARNIADVLVSCAMTTHAIDTSVEMAHARKERKCARERFIDNDTAENQAAYDKWDNEVKCLESIPGNCKRIPDIVKDSVFIRDVEMALGDAIKHQKARSVEDIIAEKAALKAARAEKRRKNKQAKAAAK